MARKGRKFNMSVFVLDKRGKAIMPCSEKRARLLLERGRARVHRMIPFTIRVVDRTIDTCELQPLRIKIDPGSKTTGIALVREVNAIDVDTGEITNHVSVINLMEVEHRGIQIKEALDSRSNYRRRRRGQMRYRAPRFLNRTRRTGWLPPSLQHRVDTIVAWVHRIQRWAPVTAISNESVRFDTQKMQNPDINGDEYQRGTLAEYETREYVFEKWGRKCVYCGAEDKVLNLDHVHPRARGGSNRISNLVPSCIKCNQAKDDMWVDDFLAHDKNRLQKIKDQLQKSLRDAAAVNSTRNALVRKLQETGLPVELSSGGQTKFNRHQFNIPKTHALDAVCVGSISGVSNWKKPTLVVKCMGRGRYQRTLVYDTGFPKGYLMKTKSIYGFRTGDMVKSVVTKGKKIGKYIGRVAIRKTGYFNIQLGQGVVVQGISHKTCKVIQRGDGYGYSWIKQ